jgi:hypothetical protein
LILRTDAAFVDQFGTSAPPSPNQVTQTWARLLRDKSNVEKSVHRKPFVMAVLYMLHIETQVEVSKMTRIAPNTREILKRFNKWVPCKCEKNCDREWNFVNEIGISKGGNGREECDVQKLFAGNMWMIGFQSDKVRKLEATRKSWEAVMG